MAVYGMPYQGSKSAIAPWVVDHLPEGDCLVDVFFGGGAVTHCAMLRGKYHSYIGNDMRGTATLFKDLITGRRHVAYTWVDRAEFKAIKDHDALVGLCWSFGNDWKSYLYGAAVAPGKYACHRAIVDGVWDELQAICPAMVQQCRPDVERVQGVAERYTALKQSIRRHRAEWAADNAFLSAIARRGLELEHLERMQRLEHLERMQRLEHLERMQRLEHLERMQAYIGDYRHVPVPPGAVIYCDPPYKAHKGYDAAFDHAAFYEWAADMGRRHPLVISEYNIDDPRFEVIAERVKTVCVCATQTQHAVERLYMVKR